MRTLYAWAVLLLAPMVAAGSNDAYANDAVAAIGNRLEAGDYKGITGGMVAVDGKYLFEAYAPGNNPDKRHDIRSATKSITALLVGELVEDGLLSSTKKRIADILPETFSHLPESDPRRAIRIEDALTMRTGLACNDWAPASVGHEDKMYKTPDWAAFLLNQPVAYERGKHFSYCTGGVVLLGRVIEKLSGRPVPDYAEERLFDPLGITDARWEKTPKGFTDTGGHLHLTLSGLHKIGQLVLAGGKWEGEQLVARKWLEAAMSKQTDVYERRQKYGYLWWLDTGEVKGKPMTLIYAHGNGGNFIFIVPELKLVAAFTGKNYGKPSQFIPMQLLSQEIVPALVQ